MDSFVVLLLMIIPMFFFFFMCWRISSSVVGMYFFFHMCDWTIRDQLVLCSAVPFIRRTSGFCVFSIV